MEYHERLRDTYQHHPAVGRILRHRQVPKTIYTASNELRTIQASQRRKKHNRITQTKTGEEDRSDRVESIVKVGFEDAEVDQ
jgi:WD repeat and SOF domain-containing protein 1